MSCPSRIRGLPAGQRALEIRQVLLGQRHRMRLVAGDQSDDPVAPLHVDGPDILGPILAEPTAFDHRRTTHTDVGVGSRDDDVTGAGQRRVAGETTPGHDRYQRHLPLSVPSVRKVGTSRPATVATSVSPGRPPPPSANNTTGSFLPAANSKTRSVLAWL